MAPGARRSLKNEGTSASFGRLRAYLAARATLTPAEVDFILRLYVARRLQKGEVLQRAGDPARYMIFVAEGCLRSYVMDEKGKVHIVRFAPEEWWLADSSPFQTREPATLFIDAIEPSDVLLIDQPSHQRILDGVPAYAAAYQGGLQRLAGAMAKRVVNSLSASAHDRYLDFVNSYPTLVGRLPLRMLASYLGMSPETLSRVRRKLATRVTS